MNQENAPPAVSAGLPPLSHRILFKPIPEAESGGCHLDVYLPKTADGAPIAFMIHGGGWTMGSSDHLPHDQVTLLLESGWAVVSTEYRLMPHASMKDIREDCLDAYKYILSGLSKEIGAELDTSRIIVTGWSAGGTQTMFLPIDAAAAGLPLPKALIPTYPKLDFESGKSVEEWQATWPEDKKKELSDFQDKSPMLTGWKGAWFGDYPRFNWLLSLMQGGAMHPWLFRHAPPLPAECSPINLLHKDFPPTHLIQATEDVVIPPSETETCLEKLQALGVDAVLSKANGMPHGICEAGRETWPADQKWWEEAIEPALRWAMAKAG